jgi:serine/threonine-protein kinase HipA
LACLAAAGNFLLSREKTIEIIEAQLRCLIDQWDAICDETEITPVDRSLLWGRQFLNPFAFEDLGDDASHLKAIADEACW